MHEMPTDWRIYMRTIYKYPLYPASPCRVEIPARSIIRHVGQQNDVPTLWVEVDITQDDKTREFFIYGTGHTIVDVENLVYVGTTVGDPFVWHVYERFRS